MLKARIKPHGGIHPDSHKELTNQQEIRTLLPPWRLILALRQHAGAAAIPVVAVGDQVAANQLLAKANGRFSMPIHAPLAATVSESSYQASLSPEGVASYRLRAVFEPGQTQQEHVRIGLRGTAKIYGERVLLGYYLFRRPLATVREWTGL